MQYQNGGLSLMDGYNISWTALPGSCCVWNVDSLGTPRTMLQLPDGNWKSWHLILIAQTAGCTTHIIKRIMDKGPKGETQNTPEGPTRNLQQTSIHLHSTTLCLLLSRRYCHPSIVQQSWLSQRYGWLSYQINVGSNAEGEPSPS